MNFASKKNIVFIVTLLILYINAVYADSSIINNISIGPTVCSPEAYEPLSRQILGKKNGDTIIFGKYEQDNVLENGPEPVEWIILGRNEYDKTITLISVYLLDCMRFNGFSEYVTWETSSLRDYLNNTVLNIMFTDSEKTCIKSSYLENMPNPYNNSLSGNPTYDYLYIPGIEDIVTYFSDDKFVGEALYSELLTENPKRMAVATKYAIERGLRTTPANHKYPYRGNYFLRTIGQNGHRIWYNDVYADFYQSYISEMGVVKPEGTGVNSCDDGIRIMMQVYY